MRNLNGRVRRLEARKAGGVVVAYGPDGYGPAHDAEGNEIDLDRYVAEHEALGETVLIVRYADDPGGDKDTRP